MNEQGLTIKERDIERAKKYYQDNTPFVDLPKRLQEQIIRWESAHVWVHEFNERRKVVAMLKTRFGVTENQAYIDIRNMQNIFGRAEDWNYEFKRQFMWEKILNYINKEELKGKPDMKVVALFMEQLRRLNDKPIELDQPNRPEFNFTKIIITNNYKAAGVNASDDIEGEIDYYLTNGELKKVDGK